MIPATIDMIGIEMGTALLLIGMLALLLVVLTREGNTVGLVLWGITVVMVSMSALFGIGIEIVYIGILLTGVLTVAGFGLKVVN